MKRMRMMGLCLVAAFALTAIGAGTASALPEIGRCVEKAAGKYSDSNCTKKAAKGTGTKEFLKGGGGVKLGFTSKGGEGVLQTQSGNTVKCATQTAVGEYKEKTGAIKEVTNVVATFTGCKLLASECKSAGAGLGEIVTKKLGGKIGYISKVGKTVGQELHPLAKTEKIIVEGKEVIVKGRFAIFQCGAVANSEVGEGPNKGGNCLIAPLTNTNEMSFNATQSYAGDGKGNQIPQKFDGSTKVCNLEASLNGAPFERSTQSLITEVTNEQELEIKA